MELETIYLLIIAFLGSGIVWYWVVDLHWFYRVLLCVVQCLLCKKKVHILDETSYYGICWTSDVDIWMFHMNNAKFLRELDFAKTDFLLRTQIFQHVRKKKGMIVLGSSSIRYRRFIKVFQLFRITTRIVYWDSNSIYFEHRYITLKDNFVCAIAYGKQRITNVNVEELMTLFVDKNVVLSENGNSEVIKPPLPPEIGKLMELEELSSAKLRSEVKNGEGRDIQIV